MAMNIPAPVQILRYEIPEGSTVNDVYEYVYNNIKEGMMLLIVGDVLSNNLSREANEKFTTVMFAIGVKYGDVVSPVFIPMIMYGTGIDENYIYTDVGSNLFTFSVSDVIPSNANNNYNDSSMSSRGLIVGPTYKTNIDTVHEYGIYWPDADSTLPEEVKSRNNLVLHYSSSGRSPTNIQILLSSMEFGTSNPVLIYTRQSGSIHPSGPEDWSPWQPLGGGSSLTAGDGISITDGAVAVDDTVVRTNKEFQTITGSLLIDGVADSNTLHDGTEISKLGIVSCVSDPDDTNIKAISTLMPYRLNFSINRDTSSNIDFSSYNLEVKEDDNYGSLDITANYPNKVDANAVISLRSPKDVDTNEPFCTAPSTRATPTDNEIITYDYFRDHAVALRTGNIYVDNVNGSDSNDGLTADTALATFDAAITLRQKCVFYNSDSGDSMVTINLAASDTAYSYSKYSIPNNTTITVYGSNTDGLSEADLNIIYLSFRNCYAKFEKINFTAMLNTNISNKYIMELEHSCVDMVDCTIRDRNINGIIGFMQVESNSSMNFYPATILCHSNKGYDYIFQATSNSNIELDELSITGTNIVIKSNGAVLQTNNNSTVNIYTEGEMSSVTGKKYKCYNGSGINTHGLGANAIPGTEEGTVDGNSWYA